MPKSCSITSSPGSLSTPPRQCSSCVQPEATLPIGTLLKACARCRSSFYCSKECQTKDWPTHKKTCRDPSKAPKPQVTGGASLSGLLSGASSTKTFLHNRPEKETYKLLVDAYRLRIEDEYTMTGDVSEDSLYGGGNPLKDFRRFLNKAEKVEGLLPDWWSKQKRAECEKLGIKAESGWGGLKGAMEKSDVIEYWKDPMMPMCLRMVGEFVYGKGVGYF